jgi:hypothetical protein
MTGAPRTAEYRRLFQRAVRENIGMDEARRRIAEERWFACEKRLAERRCGTRTDDAAAAVEQAPFWWQQL